MSTLLRALRSVFARPSAAEYGDRELGALKARAQATMDNMLRLKREREQQRLETEHAVINSLKTLLMSLEAAELDAKTKQPLTAEQQRVIASTLGEIDRKMDAKEREVVAGMSKQVEKHVARVAAIQQAPADQKERLLQELTDTIMAEAEEAPPRK
eukprot:jgi/Tetstr1/430422/TSEL_020232.t1